jgi:hypothetical protein
MSRLDLEKQLRFYGAYHHDKVQPELHAADGTRH